LDSDKLFVYGTFLWEQTRYHFLRNMRFVGRGKVQGCLFDAGPYPVFTKQNPAERLVIGELYQSDNLINYLHELDEIEGYYPESKNDSLFTRELTKVIISQNQQENAYIYVYNAPVTGLECIVSGDYAQYLHESSTAWVFFFGSHLLPGKFESGISPEILQSCPGFLDNLKLASLNIRKDRTLFPGMSHPQGDKIQGILYRLLFQQIQEILDPIYTKEQGLTRTILKIQADSSHYAYAETYLPKNIE